MDNVIVDFESGIALQDKETLSCFEGRYDEIPYIFNDMIPMKGAIEAYHQLNKWFDVYICSTAPWNNHTAWSAKNLWVRKHLGDIAEKRLILTHHKNLVMGDYLIDDRLKNGVDKFTGEHIHFGTLLYPDWDSVLKYLKSTI